MNLWKTPSPPEPLPRRPRGLVQEIVAGLSSSIKNGDIKAGDKLPPESALMAQFDVSRTVVREALSKLQASHFVETRHGVGTFALPAPQEAGNFKISVEDLATVADVIAVLELRMGLETEAAGLAALRRSLDNLAAMAAALQGFEAAINADLDAVPSDFQFHLEVAKATHNPHFEELMTYLGAMIIPRTRVNTPTNDPQGRLNYLRRVHGEHQAIYQAIHAQNDAAARSAMRTHLGNSLARLQKA